MSDGDHRAPSAIASSTTPGSPATREGMTTTSAATIRSATSVRAPSSRTSRPTPSARRCPLRVGQPAARPCPASYQHGEIGNVPGCSLAEGASISTSRPFWRSCRAITRTTGCPRPSPIRRPYGVPRRLEGRLAEHVAAAGAGYDVDAWSRSIAQSAGHVPLLHRFRHGVVADGPAGRSWRRQSGRRGTWSG